MKVVSPILWLLDNAHGGFVDGSYQSPGKQSPRLPNGETLYEGTFSRDVVERIATLCKNHDLPFKLVACGNRDLPLDERVRTANNYHASHPQSIFISVRLNKNRFKTHEKFSNAHGLSVNYYKTPQKLWWWGNNKFRDKSSRQLASLFLKYLGTYTELYKRGTKASKHQSLRGLQMPGIITRSGYINNLQDSQRLMCKEVVDKIAMAHFEAMQYVSRQGFQNLSSMEMPLLDIPTSLT